MADYRDTNAYSSLLAKVPIEILVQEAIATPGLLEQYLEIINNDKSSIKFAAEKVIRLVSESVPELVYPYFKQIASLIDSKNSFIKWGAIITISNLVAVDQQELFLNIFEQYFAMLDDNKMVTAANVAGNAWKIALRYPDLEPDITSRLIKAAGNIFHHKGEPSPECNNVMCGHLIDCFDHYFEHSKRQAEIIAFLTRQQHNPRKKVATKAKAFLKNNRSGPPK